MSLKHSFTKLINPEYNAGIIKENLKAELQLVNAVRSIPGHQIENEYLREARSHIDRHLKYVRGNLKSEYQVPKYLRKVHITSTKEWNMYPEYIGDDCGRTRYNPVEKFKVDVIIPYDKEEIEVDSDGNTVFDPLGRPKVKQLSIKEAIRKAELQALEPLKAYRKKSREIPFIEKTYSIPGLPHSTKYKVYAGNGIGGPALTYKYVDAWSGYNGMEFTKPEQHEQYFIHMEGGTFLKLQELARTRRVFERKAPRTNDKHVGIELEFISKMDKLELASELVKENVQEFVFLTDDGSIKFHDKDGNVVESPVDDFKYRHELTMVAPEQLVHEVIKRMLRAINKDGKSKVGARCGFHVHLDMRNRDKYMVFHNLSKAQHIMYAMNPRSRLDGTTSKGKRDTAWSKKINHSDFDEAMAYLGGSSESRYHGINLLALNKHQTIEIRIHSGTTNEEKVSNWVKILTTIANMNSRVETEAHKAETFCEYYGLDESMCTYINSRIAKFRDKEGKHVTIDEVA